MRCFALKIAALMMASLTIVLAMTVSGWAQNVGGRQNGLNIGAMAQQIFTQSDRNHNNLLSRTEFSTAQLLTDNTVASLGRAGLIGRGRPFFQTQFAGAPRLQGGMLGQQGGLPALQITNTNRVTQPQFTNYFQNAVARGDALWRQVYASNRRTNGRAYPRYGRGYGYSPYRNYGHGSYRPSMMAGLTETTTTTTTTTNPAHNHQATGPGSTGGTNASGAAAGLPSGVNVVPEGSAVTLAGTLEHEHHAKHNKTGSSTGTSAGKGAASAAKIPNAIGRSAKAGTASPFKPSARNQNARTLVTAMAQSRAAARRAYSAGGGGNGLSGYGGGGHGGGSAAHMGGGGGHAHGGGGHSGGGHGGGHHR